jgi:hypothetical protein
MMRPRTSTLVAGHPVVMTPLLLIDGFIGYVATDTQGFGWGTVLPLVIAGWLMNCAKEAGRYRAWRRDWESLDPDYRPPQHFLKAAGYVVALIGAAATVWLLANFNDPNSSAHVVAPLLIATLVVAVIAKLALRLRRRRPTSADWIVTQAIPRPVPAPSVAEAFARLPDYCRSSARKDPA